MWRKRFQDIACRKCEGNIEEPHEQDKKLCSEVETVKEATD